MAGHNDARDSIMKETANHEEEDQLVDVDHLPEPFKLGPLRHSCLPDVYGLEKACFLINGVKRVEEETKAIPMSVEKTRLFMADVSVLGEDVLVLKYREHAVVQGEEAFAKIAGK